MFCAIIEKFIMLYLSTRKNNEFRVDNKLIKMGPSRFPYYERQKIEKEIQEEIKNREMLDDFIRLKLTKKEALTLQEFIGKNNQLCECCKPGATCEVQKAGICFSKYVNQVSEKIAEAYKTHYA